MEFKYSLSLLFSNMGYAMKIIIWLLICVLITAAIGAAVMIPITDALSTDAAVAAAFDDVSDSVTAFMDGNSSIRAFVDSFSAGVRALFSAIGASAGLTAALVIAAVLLYALYTFLSGIGYYPVSYVVRHLMSSNMRMGMASSMAMNFRKAVAFSACRTSLAVPLNLAVTALLAGLYAGLHIIIGVFTLPVILAAGVLLFSLRGVLFAGWLPRLLFCPEEKIYTAFARSLRSVKLNVKGLFKAFLITYFVTYAIVAAFGLPTFGLIALVVPSVNYFLLRAVELVGYYKMTGQSFYTDATTVVDTVEFGYRPENQTAVRDGAEYADNDDAPAYGDGKNGDDGNREV